jgi:hypothetical protein
MHLVWTRQDALESRVAFLSYFVSRGESLRQVLAGAPQPTHCEKHNGLLLPFKGASKHELEWHES